MISMSIDDAKQKLAKMQEDMKLLNSLSVVDREYKSYLQVQIDSYIIAIDKFESGTAD